MVKRRRPCWQDTFKNGQILKVSLIRMAAESPEKAYRLRRLFPDLHEDVKRIADEIVCRSPEYSFRSLRTIRDLDHKVRKEMGFRVCSDPAWAMRLLRERLAATPEVFDTALRSAAKRRENLLSIMAENLWVRPDGSVNQELRRQLEAEAVRNFLPIVMKLKAQLHPDTMEILELIRLGLDVEEAIHLVHQKTSSRRTIERNRENQDHDAGSGS